MSGAEQRPADLRERHRGRPRACRCSQYRQAVSYGGVVCDSQETGVRCVNRATGHGFRVARASYDLF